MCMSEGETDREGETERELRLPCLSNTETHENLDEDNVPDKVNACSRQRNHPGRRTTKQILPCSPV